jgi:outer membrane protein TolC
MTRTLVSLSMAALCTLGPGVLVGQTLTLEEALTTAREHNARLAANRQMAEAAAGGVRISRSAYLPELRTSGNYSQYSGDVFFGRFVPPAPGQPPTDETPIGSFDSTQALLFTLSQTLYSGGGNAARLDASRIEQTIAEAEVGQLGVDLDYEVTEAYLQVVLADKAVEVAGNGVERTEQNLESVRRLREEEEALEVDVLAAQAQLAFDRHALHQAENDRALAILSLNRLLGRDPESPVETADVLGQTSDPISDEDALARAQANHPEIRKASLRVDLAAAGIKGARSHFRPKMSVDGLYSWLDNEMFFKGTYWGAGLNLSIPFARNVAEGRGSVAQAQARKSAAESLLDEASTAVQLLTRRALSEASEASRAVAVAEEGRRFHAEKYRVTSSAFTENLATFDDLLRENVELGRAELALYQAQYQARLAEAALRRLVAAP